MSGERQDPEQIIRNWLSDSAPDRAPASLREKLEDVTTRPAGHARPAGSARPAGRVAMPSFRLAGGLAAAVAVLVLVGSSAYLYGTSRTTPTAPIAGVSSSVSGRTIAGDSPDTSPDTSLGTSPSTTSDTKPSITPVPEVAWRGGTGSFPQLPSGITVQSPIYAQEDGGFMAFVPVAVSASRSSQSRPGALAAPVQSAGPIAVVTPYEIRIFTSINGGHWDQVSVLPGQNEVVRSMVYSGGRYVVVGSVYDFSTQAETPTVWTSADMETWQTVAMPAPEHTGAYGIVAGPSGLLAWGESYTSTEFWTSPNGIDWKLISVSGLPSDIAPDQMYEVPGGYAIRGFDKDRAAVWQSSDGVAWVRAWAGPGSGGPDFLTLGKPIKAPSGGYVSFGSAGAGGGPLANPQDIVVWNSTDLIHWTVSARVKAPGWITGYAAIAGGYVAVGAQVDPANAATGALGPLRKWTSTDGKTWMAVRPDPLAPDVQVLSVVSDGYWTVIACADKDGRSYLETGNVN
jgi:hypothetical protein